MAELEYEQILKDDGSEIRGYTAFRSSSDLYIYPSYCKISDRDTLNNGYIAKLSINGPDSPADGFIVNSSFIVDEHDNGSMFTKWVNITVNTTNEGEITGWVRVKTYDSDDKILYKYGELFTKEITTSTSNSSENDERDVEAPFDPDDPGNLKYALERYSANYDDNEISRFSNVDGVFGLPYQFLPDTDPRIDNDNLDISIGYEYADRIVTRMPLLFLSPGKASFMKHYSKSAKKNILQYLYEKAADIEDNNKSLDDLISSNDKYYTFEYDTARYYTYVNPMCRIAARYLELQDVTIDGVHLDEINWMDYTRRRIKSIGDFGDYTSIPFYVDSETSINESFSNSTGQSMIASSVNSISDYARELNFLLGYSQSALNLDIISQDKDIQSSVQAVNDQISKLLGGGNGFLTNLSKHLTTVASGGKLMFPEIWQDSSFSRSYSCNIKLISPDASKLSIFLNVLVPLFHLIGLVAPQGINANPNGYTNPFIVRAIYKGFFNVDMGIITSMSISKGAKCQWTPDGIPTSVEVGIDIKDLYPAMSITSTNNETFKYDTLNNTAQMDYIANLCGINIFKPEIARMIDMWYVNNFTNRIRDFVDIDIFGKMQTKVQNKIMNFFR